MIPIRNIAFLILLSGYCSAANSQTIRGAVYDRSTDSTLSNAMVYISGTSIGAYSDLNGNFELKITGYSSLPVTISMLGYYSVTLSEHLSNKNYDIFLSPKIKELNEVVVKAKKGNRETYLRIFKREFLGETGNARECVILNEKDLRFSYSAASGILKAYSSEPIMISNKALGYTLTYYLDKFNYTRNTDEMRVLTESSTILGNFIFKDELPALTEPEKKSVLERRKNSYLGSRMHFFRVLYSGNLIQDGKYNILLSGNKPDSKGFSISSSNPIKSDSLVVRKDSLSGYLKSNGLITVSYSSRSTMIDIKMDSVYFEKDGFFDPFGIDFAGEMSKQRIGDLLPFEYSLNNQR
jgi:hypothetical protein